MKYVILPTVAEACRHILTILGVFTRQALRGLHVVIAVLTESNTEQMSLPWITVRANVISVTYGI